MPDEELTVDNDETVEADEMEQAQVVASAVDRGAPEVEDAEETSLIEIPDIIPILPLRNVVVYPLTAQPLNVGQPRSVRLVDDAVGSGVIIGLVASKDPELEEPTPDDTYLVGTAATIHRLFKAPDGTIRLIVQGLERILTKGNIFKYRPCFPVFDLSGCASKRGRCIAPGLVALQRIDQGHLHVSTVITDNEIHKKRPCFRSRFLLFLSVQSASNQKQ